MYSLKDIHAADSVNERMQKAARALAVLPGDVRNRLEGVVIILLPLKTTDFPADLQDSFRLIMGDLTKHPAELKGEGAVQATMRRIQNRTGSKYAERIYDLNERVQKIRAFNKT